MGRADWTLVRAALDAGLLEADRFLIGNVKQALNYRAAMVWLETELAAVTAWSLNRPKDGGIR